MNAKDSLKLAVIKIRSRKTRTFFSGCSVMLGVIIVFMFYFALTGVYPIVKKVFYDPLRGRNIVISSIWRNEQDEKGIEESFREDYGEYGIKNIYKVRHLDSLTVESVSLEGDTADLMDQEIMSYVNIKFLDEEIIKKFLYSNYTFDNTVEEKIPAIVPLDLLVEKERKERGITKANSKILYELRKSVVDNYIGKDFTFCYLVDQYVEFPELDIDEVAPSRSECFSQTYKIVGFTRSTLGTDAYLYMNSIILPSWYFESFNAKDYHYNIEFLVEFEDSEGQEAYLKEVNDFIGMPDIGFEPSGSKYEIGYSYAYQSLLDLLEDGIKAIQIVIGVIVGVIFLISGLFIFSTVSKIVSDSKKEIGVFRAIGARRSDISKVFYLYTALTASLGILFALVLAVLINSTISILYGDDVYYFLLYFGNTIDIAKPLLLFVGLSVIPIIGVFFPVQLISLLAATIPVLRAVRIKPIVALREE